MWGWILLLYPGLQSNTTVSFDLAGYLECTEGILGQSPWYQGHSYIYLQIYHIVCSFRILGSFKRILLFFFLSLPSLHPGLHPLLLSSLQYTFSLLRHHEVPQRTSGADPLPGDERVLLARKYLTVFILFSVSIHTHDMVWKI